MNQLQALSAQSKTMTSLEIAEITGKRHDHVMRDIRTIEEALRVAYSHSPNLGSQILPDTYKNKRGKEQPMFRLDKDTTLTLLSGYDIVARHKIITRWSQLETERIEEENSPELAIQRGTDRAVKAWRKQGRDDKWIEARIKGVATRNGFTRALAAHGVKHGGFKACTNAIYNPLYGGTAEVVRTKKGLPEKANIRENMGHLELMAVEFAEAMAQTNINDRNLRGNAACELACTHASKLVAKALIQNKNLLPA